MVTYNTDYNTKYNTNYNTIFLYVNLLGKNTMATWEYVHHKCTIFFIYINYSVIVIHSTC